VSKRKDSLPVWAVPRLAQDEEAGGTGREAGGGRRLGAGLALPLGSLKPRVLQIVAGCVARSLFGLFALGAFPFKYLI
jgi:hypothetical protein